MIFFKDKAVAGKRIERETYDKKIDHCARNDNNANAAEDLER